MLFDHQHGNIAYADVLQRAFWKAFAGIDVAMDVAIASLAVLLFYDLNMPTKVKVPVILAFSARILQVPPSTLKEALFR
jgi:hypothetical protein